MKARRIITLVLALLLALSCFSALAEFKPTPIGEVGDATRDYVEPPEGDWLTPYDPVVNIRLAKGQGSDVVFENGEDQTNNEWIRAWYDKLGVQVSYDWIVYSGEYQRKLNNTRDKAAARLLVADPGCSAHQLGLAMDIKGSKDGLLNSAFGKTPAGIWLAENAWRFGFIIRYKEEWTDITTYAYEPWHVRYVGKKHAAILQELDIPLEQYVEALRSLAADALPEGE